jgi:hypothetical protein
VRTKIQNHAREFNQIKPDKAGAQRFLTPHDIHTLQCTRNVSRGTRANTWNKKDRKVTYLGKFKPSRAGSYLL